MSANSAIGDGLRVEAPAKINLYLHVVGRRADGFHLLDSLVVFAAVHDVLTVRAAAGIGLAIDGRYAAALAPDEDNLVMRAARLLAAAGGVSDGASMRLTKTLPVAAGLGGGSADAAAALRALSVLWNLHLSDAQLFHIAQRLGADVPVCLHGSSAFVSGIGEVIEPVPALPPVGMVLVNPSVMVATPDVFRARTGAFSAPGRFEGRPADAAAMARLLAVRRNDLTAAAAAIAPLIGAVLEALESESGCLLARLSGSGPTCFGLFGDAALAQDAAARLGAAHPDWWVCPTRCVST